MKLKRRFMAQLAKQGVEASPAGIFKDSLLRDVVMSVESIGVVVGQIEERFLQFTGYCD